MPYLIRTRVAPHSIHLPSHPGNIKVHCMVRQCNGGDDGHSKDYKEWGHRNRNYLFCLDFYITVDIKVGLVGVALNGLVILGVRSNRSSTT